jgi:hypothetical protein
MREAVEVWLHSFLTSVLAGGEWSHWGPRCFTPKDFRYPMNRRTGGLQSRRFENDEHLLPLPGTRTPYRLGCSLITKPTELHRLFFKRRSNLKIAALRQYGPAVANEAGHVGFVVGKVTNRCLGFPVPLTVPPLFHIHHGIIRRTDRGLATGCSLTAPQ